MVTVLVLAALEEETKFCSTILFNVAGTKELPEESTANAAQYIEPRPLKVAATTMLDLVGKTVVCNISTEADKSV